MENYFTGKYLSLEKAPLDPTNKIFNRPKTQTTTDLRPELKYTYKSIQKIVLRPRFTYAYETFSYSTDSEIKTSSQGKVDLTDAYIESVWDDDIRTSVGLQVYQWGPAEFLNASNPLFHLNAQQRSILFKEKGKVLARINVDYTRNWNQVFIYEPLSNTESEWIEGEKFTPKALVKTEWLSESGVNSLGLVLGKDERSLGFFGEYFSVSPMDGYSFYLDSKHMQNSPAFYPDTNPYGSQSLYYDPITRDGWISFGVVGIRGEWNHLDLRFEYVYNTAGWTPAQFKEAKAILTSMTPDTPTNLARFARPGLELPGRGYGYISARFFNIGKKDNHSIAFRYLVAENDGSGTLLGLYEWEATDSITVFSEYSGSFGPESSELNLLPQHTYLLGFKWSL